MIVHLLVQRRQNRRRTICDFFGRTSEVPLNENGCLSRRRQFFQNKCCDTFSQLLVDLLQSFSSGLKGFVHRTGACGIKQAILLGRTH